MIFNFSRPPPPARLTIALYTPQSIRRFFNLQYSENGAYTKLHAHTHTLTHTHAGSALPRGLGDWRWKHRRRPHCSLPHKWQLQPLFGKCIHGCVIVYAQYDHRPDHHVHTPLSYPSLLLLTSVRSLGQHYCCGTFDGGLCGALSFMAGVKEGILFVASHLPRHTF